MSARLPAAARREQLLAAALGVFAGRGLDGASMNDVADAAGVTKPVLYQHFASKRALYQALLEEVGASLRTAITKATVEASTPREQVERGFAAWYRWINDERDGFRLLFGSGTRRDSGFAATVRGVEDALAGAIAPLIQADVDADHQRILAWGLVGMAEASARRLVAEPVPFDPERVGHQLADLAWAGLRGVRRI